MKSPLPVRLILLLLVISGSSGVTVRLSGSSNYAVLGQTFRFTCTVTNEDAISLGTVRFAKIGAPAVCTVIPSSCTEGPTSGYSCGCVSGQSNVYYMDISSVSDQDEDTWLCGRRDVDSNNLVLPVYYGPGQVTLDKSSPQTVVESSTLTVTCSTSCKPCSYVWKKGTSTASSSRTLRLTNINRNQAEDYVCTATNTGTGTSASSRTLTVVVQYRPEVSLDTPSGTSSCRPYRVYVGQQNVQLTCRVTAANPTVTSYIWSLNGSTIPSATSSVYTLSSVSRSSGGSYTCAGRNSVGVSSSPPSLQVDVQYAPSVNLPSSRTVIEDQTLTVTCSVDSNPTASVRWTRKDGGSFTPQTGSTLTIPNIQRSQTGTYVCTATNTLSPCSGAAPPSTPVSKEVTVDVQYRPEVSLDTPSGTSSCRPYRVYAGQQNVQLTCRVTVANPTVTSYIWTLNGSTIPSATSSVYTLSPVSRSSGGSYTCAGRNSVGDSSSPPSLQVDVQYAPSVNLPSSRTVIEDQTLTVTCSVDSKPTASVRWSRKDGGSFTPQTGSTLTIPSIQRSQTGTYVCTATNTLSPCSGAAPPSTPVSKEVTVDVQYKPSISHVASSYPVTETSPLHINCSLYTTLGNPSTISYTWTGPRSYTSMGPVLTISNINRNQTGQYTCTATNTLSPSGGPSQTGTATGRFNVDVQYPALITSFTINSKKNIVTVSESDDVTMRCQVDSNPRSTVILYNGSTVLSRYSNSLADEHSWMANCRQRGNYSCSAFNSIGSVETVSKHIQFIVTCSPRLEENKPGALHYASSVGEDISLSVTFLSYPEPNFTWSQTNDTTQRNLTSLSSVIRISDVSVTAFLNLIHLQEEDFGEYQLQASNGIGPTRENKIVLLPQGPPSTPSNLTVLSQGVDYIQIAWKQELNGGSRQTFTLEYSTDDSSWKEAGALEETGEGKYLQKNITNLSPQTVYYVRVRAENTYGTTSTESVRVLTAKKITVTAPSVPVGLIVGLTVAGMLLTALIVVVIILFRRGYRCLLVQPGSVVTKNEHTSQPVTSQNISETQAGATESVNVYTGLFESLSDKQTYTELRTYENTSIQRDPTDDAYESVQTQQPRKPSPYENTTLGQKNHIYMNTQMT